MKSCFNIIRGFIALILTFLYWLFLSVSFIILPISFVLKDADSLNTALDDLRIEEQLAYLLTAAPDSTQIDLGTEEQALEIDFTELFEDEEIQVALVSTRREIVDETYKAIESNTPLNYEIDMDFFNTLYVGIMTQYFETMPVCSTWPSEEVIDLSQDSGCLPAPIAYANGIELPATVEVPSDFNITDDFLLENITDFQAAVDEGTTEAPVLMIDQDTISLLNPIQLILKNYIIIFIITILISLSLIIFIYPGFKGIMIIVGILNILSSVIAAFLWLIPSVFLENFTEEMFNQGFEKEYYQLFEDLALTVSSKALIACVCIGIIGLLLVIIGIILPKKKNEETTKEETTEVKKEQPAGEDNSSK